MKKNNSHLDDEIDLSEIIKILWNEKILILSISLVFMIAAYVYVALQPKIYKTEIVLHNAPSYLFDAYRPYLTAKHFDDELRLKLSSLDSLVQFVENNNTINDFKNYLKEKNISVEKYFQPELGTRKFNSEIDKKHKIPNQYSLTYSKPLPGEAFLHDYIIFTHQQMVNKFKQQLTQQILSEIGIFKQNLEIAEGINLETPILKSTLEERSVYSVNEPSALFYKGTKVLTIQLNHLTWLLNETKNFTLDYNPILQQSSIPSLISKSPIIFAMIFFVFGFFLSLMIIFIRSVLLNKS